MCLALYKPKDKILPKDYAAAAFEANDDGAGFAYVKNEKTYISKGYMDFDSFWSAFEKVQDYEAIVHFRFATTGAVETENTHPFKVSGGFALIHNGIINIEAIKGKTDTETYAQLVLSPLIDKYGKEILKSPSFRFMIESGIAGSKLVLLSKDTHYIFNENRGVWDNGIWYSNSTYKPVPKSLGFPEDEMLLFPERNSPENALLRLSTNEEIKLRLEEIYNELDEADDVTASTLYAEEKALQSELEYREYAYEYYGDYEVMDSEEKRQYEKYAGSF